MASTFPGPATSRLLEHLRALASPDPDARRDEVPRRGLVITLCILASVLLWFTFAIRETYTRSIDFPIEVSGLEPGESLAGLPPMTVRAQVAGEGIQLLRLFYDRPSIRVDASTGLVDLETVAPDFIQGVRIEALTPREVRFERERRAYRRLPVVLGTPIETRPGHHVVGVVEIEPDSVLVSGAESIVGGLSAWSTAGPPVLAGPDSLDATVTLSDSLAGLVTTDVRSVRLRASVRQFTQGSRMVPVRVADVPEGIRISLEPTSVRVTWQVPLSAYQEASTTDDLVAVVPYARIAADTTGAVAPVLQGLPGIVFRGIVFDPPAVRWFRVQEAP